MDLFWCWLVAPVGLLAATVGLSLLIERLADFEVPWTARPALGLATAIVIAQFGTGSDATAELTLPAILILAAFGLVAGARSLGGRPGGIEIGVGAVVFALFAAPFVLGEPSWAGYIKLDDTATWMGLTDHAFEYGRGVGELPPSTYSSMVDAYLGGGYPIGAFVPAAIMGFASGQDVAFTMQPSMAFGAAAMALLVFELSRRLLRSRYRAGAIAVLSSAAALFVGYSLWGGVKEIITAALLGLPPVLVAIAVDRGWPRSLWVPLGVALAGVIAVLGPGGAAWLAPILLPLLVLAFRAVGGPRCWRLVWPTALFTGILVLPVLIAPDGIFNPVQSVLTEETELGNLHGPLNLMEIAGIWPAIDFRIDPHLKPLTIFVAAACLLVALATLIACLRLKDGKGLPFAAFAGGGALGAAAIMMVGSPWVDGKAMATVSPALLAATLLGLALLAERTPFRIEAGVFAAVVAGFVVWGGFLAYQGAWLAPRAQAEELERIGEDFAGQGPALSTEVSIYGPRHFLRKLDAEGASDLRYRPIALTSGASAPGQYVDLDDIALGQLDPYGLLVIRRSPAASRPSVGWALAQTTDHYEVWRRVAAPGVLVDRMPLGNADDAGGVPDCGDLGQLADAAGSEGTLYAARVSEPITVDFSGSVLPTGWELSSPNTLVADGDGSVTSTAELSGGDYEIWLGGVIFGGVELFIDREEVDSERGVLNNAGASESLGTRTLDAGTHEFELGYSGPGLAPGSAEPSYQLGPLTLEPVSAPDLGFETVPASEFETLCDQRWDWIEAYTGVTAP